jgi:hypothetical protein
MRYVRRRSPGLWLLSGAVAGALLGGLLGRLLGGPWLLRPLLAAVGAAGAVYGVGQLLARQP